MTLTLSFEPEIEARLRERAVASGKDVVALVREAVEEKLAGRDPAERASRTPEQWMAEFDAWVAGHKPVTHVVDDGRESIYAGRGP